MPQFCLNVVLHTALQYCLLALVGCLHYNTHCSSSPSPELNPIDMHAAAVASSLAEWRSAAAEPQLHCPPFMLDAIYSGGDGRCPFPVASFQAMRKESSKRERERERERESSKRERESSERERQRELFCMNEYCKTGIFPRTFISSKMTILGISYF